MGIPIIGMSVTVFGMKKRTDLNGKTGIVKRMLKNGTRVAVAMSSLNNNNNKTELVSISLDNLDIEEKKMTGAGSRDNSVPSSPTTNSSSNYFDDGLKSRNDEALGKAMNAMANALTPEERANIDGNRNNNRGTFAELEQQQDVMSSELTSKEDKKLMIELVRIFDIEYLYDNKIKTGDEKLVQRASDIIDELNLNVNFKALPYGKTFLSGAVDCHGIDMIKLLLSKGADVNNEDTMDGRTALDSILEYEEEDQGENKKLSDKMNEMKILLLSKGAKTYEERMNELTMNVRAAGK